MQNGELTYEEAIELLEHPKVIIDNGERVESYVIDLTNNRQLRIQLALADAINAKPTFLLQISTSNKNRTKITLHVQDDEDNNYCLIRIDYNGGSHHNPVSILPSVPQVFRQFADQTIYSDHVHHYVQGYKSGAWALPILKDEFPVKSVGEETYTGDVSNAIKSLAETIHLTTRIDFQSSLLM